MTSPAKDTPAHDLKVVILNDSSVAKGGATGLAVLSARLLRERGVPTTFIAGDAGDDGALAAQGVDLVPMGQKLLLDAGALRVMKRGLYNSEVRDRVAAYVAKHDTPGTIYHLHGWSRILSPAVFDALKPVAHRTFIHAHDYFLACPNGSYFDFRKEEVCTRVPLSSSCLTTACDRRALHHKLWRSARSGVLKRTFAQSYPWAGVLALHPGMHAPLVRAGLPEDRISIVRNPARALTNTRIKAEANKTFCFIGRVVAAKGVRMLCAAASQADVPLKVIGDGDLLEELRATNPNVEFTGWVDQTEMSSHLMDARALVMPSRTPEPFGLVAAEASLSGLPVILSEQALLSQDFKAQGLGFPCSTQSVAALAETLKEVANLPIPDIARLSKAAHSGEGGIALSYDAWISELLGAYQKALAYDRAA